MKQTNPTKLFAVGSAIAAFTFTPAFAGEVTMDSKATKEVKIEEKAESPFSVSFSTGYDSEYIFRGVDILNFTTDDGDLLWADINVSAYGFTAGAWYAEAINKGNEGATGEEDLNYGELDLYLLYSYTAGPVTLTGGYTFYYFPDLDDTYSHELNIGVSTSVIPFVTPSVTFYYDIAEDDKDIYDGGYLEFKLSSSIPVVGDVVSIDPYALVSYDFEYNSTESDWNHFQTGVSIPVKLTENITISGYAAYSWALSAIEDFQNDELWGGAKVSFTF